MNALILLTTLITFNLCAPPPVTWQERWYDHDQKVTRRHYDDHVAIYFDKDMDPSRTWMNTYLHDLWAYVKKTYGEFGDDPHLYAIFHKDKYHGGHQATYLNGVKSHRNVIDMGSGGPTAWKKGLKDQLDLLTFEVGAIVLGANNGVYSEAAYTVSKYQWTEIFQYDAYLALGLEEDARRFHDLKVRTCTQFPRPNTYWFRDWFLPIYEQYGGAKVSNRFFKLVAKYFPINNGTATFHRPRYARELNLGEFVVFWSGAAQVNLKIMAREAFGWHDIFEAEFQKARTDYPNVMYFNIIL